MKKVLFYGIVLVLLVAVSFFGRRSDSDKVRQQALNSYTKIYGDTPEVRKLVERYHPEAFDKAYTGATRRRKKSTLDEKEYNRVMAERLKAKLGPPRASSPGRAPD
jgi:hypothetical protein